MKTGIKPQSFYSSTGKRVLEYISPTEIVLDLPFIMTVNKRLSINMPYLKVENKLSGNDVVAIRLLDFKISDSYIQLYVQELESKKTYSLMWNLHYEGSFWLWSVADFETAIGSFLKSYNVQHSSHHEKFT